MVSEIIVGDVLAWELGLEWSGSDAELLRPLSWAVAIHPRIPALPPLRGNELLIVTQRTLDHLKRVEMVSWPDITWLLSAQPVAGLVVDREFNNPPILGVPLFRSDSSLLADAEAYLNRTITEHRGELYRLGSDLSRALSTASIGGADLHALLAVASAVGRRDLLLFDREGTVLGRTPSAPRDVPFSPAQVDAGSDWPVHIESECGRWLVDRLRTTGSDVFYLVTAVESSGAPETSRLVLSQTARSVEAFLGLLGNVRPLREAPQRESLLADLLLGRAGNDSATMLDIDLAEPLRVSMFVSNQPAALGRLRRRLGRVVQNHTALLPTGELAVLMRDDAWWDELRTVAETDSPVGLIRSEPQFGPEGIALATRQARILGRLWLAGMLDGKAVDADNLGQEGLLGILLPVWDPLLFEPRPESLTDFVDNLLGVLEQHDRERGSDLVRTLEGYLAAGGSTTGAAELLGVHRNTLGYRLNRIGELTGRDLDDAVARLAFGLALKIRAMQRILDGL